MKRWLYLIADFSCGEDKIEEVLRVGVDYIQLREKEISSAEYLQRARRLREMTQKYRTKLIINDRMDIALLSHADGVHLGQEDIPVEDARAFLGKDAVIGATAKTVEQAKRAVEQGADYLGSGAWFFTETKKDAVPISEEMYRNILQAAPVPNVAVGGITRENCRKPLSCGAHGLAVSAGILKSSDPAAETASIRKILETWEG
ncbi:MAG: thiamine phosphate synthase [Lachnospiraceae bacterium]|nr:thiamine phosphate synthase [Lachnospiraceae bacterium]